MLFLSLIMLSEIQVSTNGAGGDRAEVPRKFYRAREVLSEFQCNQPQLASQLIGRLRLTGWVPLY